jgi:hypothetical protein
MALPPFTQSFGYGYRDGPRPLILGSGGGATQVISFSSEFSLTENPISENGRWKNRGLDWTAVRTSGGIAFGTQTGSGGFDDSYAYVSGGWPANQSASATVFKGSASGIQEVEILLRVRDGPNTVTLIECNFAHSGAYNEKILWRGPKGLVLGDFDFVDSGNPGSPLVTGDIVSAQVVGNIVTAFINGIQIGAAVDISSFGNNYKSGNPGIGFYREAASGAADQYGFTRFSATGL